MTTTTETKPLFAMDLQRVRNILAGTQARYFLNSLDTDATLALFTKRLDEELREVLEDAVEVAFFRAVPEALARRRRIVAKNPEADDDAEEDASHDYIKKNHCTACSDYWWNEHSLTSCIKYGELAHCHAHMNHLGSTCAWKCELHLNHTLTMCQVKCSSIHLHSDWHTSVENGGIKQMYHDAKFPLCEYFKQPVVTKSVDATALISKEFPVTSHEDAMNKAIDNLEVELTF